MTVLFGQRLRPECPVSDLSHCFCAFISFTTALNDAQRHVCQRAKKLIETRHNDDGRGARIPIGSVDCRSLQDFYGSGISLRSEARVPPSPDTSERVAASCDAAVFGRRHRDLGAEHRHAAAARPRRIPPLRQRTVALQPLAQRVRRSRRL